MVYNTPLTCLDASSLVFVYCGAKISASGEIFFRRIYRKTAQDVSIVRFRTGEMSGFGLGGQFQVLIQVLRYELTDLGASDGEEKPLLRELGELRPGKEGNNRGWPPEKTWRKFEMRNSRWPTLRRRRKVGHPGWNLESVFQCELDLARSL